MHKFNRYLKLQKYKNGVPVFPPIFKLGDLVETEDFESLEECESSTIFRWIDNGKTICVETDLHKQLKRQKNVNGSWEDTGAVRVGALIEKDSSECIHTLVEIDYKLEKQGETLLQLFETTCNHVYYKDVDIFTLPDITDNNTMFHLFLDVKPDYRKHYFFPPYTHKIYDVGNLNFFTCQDLKYLTSVSLGLPSAYNPNVTWELGRVYSLSSFFRNCENLTYIDPRIFETRRKAISYLDADIDYFFYNCKKLSEEVMVLIINTLPFISDQNADKPNWDGYFFNANHAFSFTQLTDTTILKHVPCAVLLRYAFEGCELLVKASYLPYQAYDYEGCFLNCINLTEICDINKDGVFNYFCKNCHALKAIPFINDGDEFLLAFMNCTSLTRVDSFPKGVGPYESCFEGCTSLVSVTALIGIGNVYGEPYGSCKRLFYGCLNLVEYVDKQESAAIFGNCDSAFYDCGKLNSHIIVFNDVINLLNCFAKCRSLTIPPTMGNFTPVTSKTLANLAYAFWDCEKLPSFPRFINLENIGDLTGTFSGCIGIQGETPLDSSGCKWWQSKQFTNLQSSYGCFGGCTLLSDYNQIPNNWK